jgi:CubicO group peptidase (beta-lactamase class C family)
VSDEPVEDAPVTPSALTVTDVVSQLAKEGKLSLDDTVGRWLPGLLRYGDRITISS